jgi:hypothetical protein
MLNSQQGISTVHLLTHVLNETVDDLENLGSGRPSLVVREPI